MYSSRRTRRVFRSEVGAPDLGESVAIDEDPSEEAEDADMGRKAVRKSTVRITARNTFNNS
jgi:hypothetical protein